MSIRNAAKALIFNNSKILLNKCETITHEIYYTLPGGGQNQYETIEEAVKRECLEETGYTVKIDRFIALYEEIITDEELQNTYPDYTHKIFHIFLCELENEKWQLPSEKDMDQLGCEWIPIENLCDLIFYPDIVGENVNLMLQNQYPVFLGAIRSKTSLCVPK